MKPSHVLILIVIGSAALFILACCAGTLFLGRHAPPIPPAPQAEPASEPAQRDPGEISGNTGRLLVEQALENSLVAPSTAEYPADTITARELPRIEGHRAWFVTGAVDSENRLGVPVRGQWEIVFVLTDGDYFPLFVSLDGETVFGDSAYRP